MALQQRQHLPTTRECASPAPAAHLAGVEALERRAQSHPPERAGREQQHERDVEVNVEEDAVAVRRQLEQLCHALGLDDALRAEEGRGEGVRPREDGAVPLQR
eukprot:6054089-Prymnesium_polylepis.2